jgi:DNA-binding transcriptional LysR family regulator
MQPPVSNPHADRVIVEPALVQLRPRQHAVIARRRAIDPADLHGEPLVWWPRDHGPGPWEEMLAAVYGEGRRPAVTRTEPEEERLVHAVAEGAGVSFIMLERSRTLRVPGAVYRRFTAPEPTVGIALAWPRGRDLPVVERLREVAEEISAAPTARA